MKKLMSGLVMGLVLTLSMGVFANSDLIGRTIQGTFPLVINGERASQDVIVVDGVSYLPVRSAGEMFGYHVDFQNETVILNIIPNTPPIVPVEHLPQEEDGEKVKDLRREISKIDGEFGEAHQNYLTYMVKVMKLESKEELTEEEKQELEVYKQKANEYLELRNSLQQQKADLESQLEQLQASE